MLRTLHRVADRAAVERVQRGRAGHRGGAPDPGRGPLRPRAHQGPHPRLPGRAQAARRRARADPLLPGAAGRRQDVAGPIDRAGDGAQVRAHLAGRRARRGRDPRSPPHLRRRAARAASSRRSSRRAPTTRCCCSTRSTSWAPTCAAIRRRRCWRCWTPSRTTPSATTTWASRSISRRCCSSRPRTCPRPFRRRCAIEWRPCVSPATARKRSWSSPSATWCRSRSARRA